MIVWLASYPRSGNTLLRQVLKRCFGLDSYEAPGPVFVDLPDAPDRHGWAHSKRLGYEGPNQAEMDSWIPVVEPLLTRDPRLQ